MAVMQVPPTLPPKDKPKPKRRWVQTPKPERWKPKG